MEGGCALEIIIVWKGEVLTTRELPVMLQPTIMHQDMQKMMDESQ